MDQEVAFSPKWDVIKADLYVIPKSSEAIEGAVSKSFEGLSHYSSRVGHCLFDVHILRHSWNVEGVKKKTLQTGSFPKRDWVTEHLHPK